jgi:hypothetical protein
LKFKIDDAIYYIPRHTYIKRFGIGEYEECSLYLSGWDQDMWIMGLDFFTNYYMVFDHDNEKIGIALGKNAD